MGIRILYVVIGAILVNGTLGLSCLKGSPKNCKATNIPVKGYSAGQLIRIVNGFKIQKITQQDSCPSGWKLWSPRNKKDWTIVYNAMGKNINNYPKKPHLLIDVTRNQKGCGGCTKFAMKSGVKQQNSWKTSDGSAWWLRDTSYNEPNGDYQPNCFLHIYDVSPNNVRFNDGSCSYYSSDYLCQPAVNPSGFVKKYNKKYPHCANVKCMNNTPKRTFEKECAKRKICTGFTFQSGKSTGPGCLKKCGAKEFGGYGSGAYDYWAKAAKKPGAMYTTKAKGFKVCGVEATGLTTTSNVVPVLNTTTSNADPVSNASKSPFWDVYSGSQYCKIVDGGRCLSGGSGQYGPYERCKVVALRPLVVKATRYDVESCCDFVTVDEIKYRGKRSWGPNGAYLRKGGVLSWRRDNRNTRSGFKVCATPAPYSFWYKRSGKELCEITDGGRCVRNRIDKYAVSRGIQNHAAHGCKVMALRPLVINTTYYVVGTPMDFIGADGVRYNPSGPNGVYLKKFGMLEWYTGHTGSIPRTTTFTPTSATKDTTYISWGYAFINFPNLIFLLCTTQVFGGFGYGINFLIKRKRLRRMRVDNDGISQVDATVTKKYSESGKNSTSYYLSYTFTGVHPSRGPFRMTRNNNSIDSDLYDSLEVGATVAVCYTDVDPKDCALVSDVDAAFKTIGCHYIVIFTILAIWMAGMSALPLYYNVYGSLFGVAVVMLLLLLAQCAIELGICCSVQFLVFALCNRRNTVIQYGEDIELASAPTDLDSAASEFDMMPLAIAQAAESCEADGVATETDGVAQAATDVADASTENTPGDGVGSKKPLDEPADEWVDGGDQCELGDLKTFLTTPTPAHIGPVHCFVVQTDAGFLNRQPEYRLYLEHDKRFLIGAKKSTKRLTSHYMITTSEFDLLGSEAEELSVCKLRSNIRGNEFVLYDMGADPNENRNKNEKKYDVTPIRKELCAVTLGRKSNATSRKMKVTVPQVGAHGECAVFQPLKGTDGLLKRSRNPPYQDCYTLITKPPVWNDRLEAWTMNFHGRVTKASSSNIQLVHPDDQDTVVMLFGRVGRRKYSLDYQYPLSPIQAFSICLSRAPLDFED